MKKDDLISKLAQFGTTHGIPKETVADIMHNILSSTSLEDITDIGFDENGLYVRTRKRKEVALKEMNDDQLARLIHDAFYEYYKRQAKAGVSQTDSISNLMKILRGVDKK